MVTGVAGAGFDCINLDGQMGLWRNVGTVASTTFTLAEKVQEADTATGTYTDIAGATFAPLTSTTGANIVGTISFQRTKRFIRLVAVEGGTTPSMSYDALFMGQFKQL